MTAPAVQYFNNGYSCSESVILPAADEGLCNEHLLSVATSFSGGASTGCMCGAVAASLMVIGAYFGRDKARVMTATFMEKFKSIHKVTCCKILSKNLVEAERKANCTNLVSDATTILEELIKVKVVS